MRHMIVFATLAIVTLSGCVGGTGDLTAQDAAKVSDAEADRRASAPLFMGSFAVEGPFDLERFQAMVEAEGDPEDAEAFEIFELRVQNGEAGDGRTGSWFNLYASFEDGYIRLLIIQVLEDGSTRTYSEDVAFEMEMSVEAEVQTVGPALLLANLPSIQTQASGRGGAAACDAPAWIVDSPRAALIAHNDATFAQHVVEQPEAEYMYLYSPSLMCEPATWTIAHLDLDLLLDEKVPDVAFVVIDATSGDILASGVDDGSMFAATETVTVLDVEATIQGPLVPTLGLGDAETTSYRFDVSDAFELAVSADGSNGHFLLEGPAGEVYEGVSLELTIEEPHSGTWTLSYAYHTQVPQEKHYVYAHAEAVVPA